MAYDFPGGSPPPSAPQDASINFAANLGMYGARKFKGAEAAKYLAKQKLPPNTMETTDWTTKPGVPDKVAAAVLDWAKTHGATMATHLFQPLGSGGMRLGQTGQVHSAMSLVSDRTSLAYFSCSLARKQPPLSLPRRADPTPALQVHNAMFNFKSDGTLGWVFSGDQLLQGETDGSSYMNGG